VNTPLQPILSMSEVYGPDRAYIPRAHEQGCQWVYPDPAMLDARTGGSLCIAGQMPTVCSAAALRPAGLELLAEAGIIISNSVRGYADGRQALEIAMQLARDGNKLVLQHVYPPGVIPDDAQSISPSLLSYLNNKRNLSELVPAAHLPPRRVVSYTAAFCAPRPAPPVVFKVATDMSTGGGVAIAVCRSVEEIDAAARRFSNCEQIVVESFLPIIRNPCLNYAVMPDGQVRYLGDADQDITGDYEYVGNWLQLESMLPKKMVEIGCAVAGRASGLGYRGILGIDLAILSDERIMVLDLNFRLNGSTAAVLLAPGIARAHGAGWLHLRRFVSREGYDVLIAAARSALRRGRLLPLATFDPQAAGIHDQRARIVAIVLGDSRDDIRAIEAEFSSQGLQ
jgi:L-aspartate-L-methionine ligase